MQIHVSPDALCPIGYPASGPDPAEQNSTCDRCAMLPPAGKQGGANELYFSPATKCCTFLPELANFLVGRVLGETNAESAAGRATVEARLDKGLGVSPLGLLRTPMYSLLYRTSPGSFGHARSMRCPHYLEEGGRCGVWRHRESTCATWFCKYGRGEKGRAFWERLHDVLVASEDSVRTHCLAELEFASDTLESLFPPHALDETV